MFDPLNVSQKISAAGLDAQSRRMRVIAENMANAHSTANTPGGDPYARKTVNFVNRFDDVLGASVIAVDQIGTDQAPFRIERNPNHPAADEDGNVKYPNVNMLVEMADMREANRSYEANLQMMKQSRAMVMMTVDLLRST
ncbi:MULTISPECIES: flagellar basal body rod protein FlgC [Hyphomicrobium]|nr:MULTISPECIES: flagellar basal body rod protein FlgC [Hyphomicrobium]MBI1648763.1 flagellar basal body rod protein FlgC [Hyphomicrobium sulfonivorans]MDH4983644.1 flagellar basal body rod protein FlgC [Hyphomicrobium sp. D-2]NSL70702.1 flagellar basal body rod protein FlgC [Hyphomicrobium sulfonivorans]